MMRDIDKELILRALKKRGDMTCEVNIKKVREEVLPGVMDSVDDYLVDMLDDAITASGVELDTRRQIEFREYLRSHLTADQKVNITVIGPDTRKALTGYFGIEFPDTTVYEDLQDDADIDIPDLGDFLFFCKNYDVTVRVGVDYE
jgi:hypothetical protein